MKKLLLGATAASLLVAAVVTMVSLLQTPTYEVSALVVHPKEQSDGKIQLIPNAPRPKVSERSSERWHWPSRSAPGPKRPSAVWGWRCPRTSSWTP